MPVVRSEKYKKKERRQKEMLRAQAKSLFRNSDYGSTKEGKKPELSTINIEKKIDNLNLKVIRSDLIKTGIYILFVILVVYLIKTFNLELNLGINK